MKAEEMKRLQKKLGLTVQGLADTMGVHLATAYRWLNGELEISKLAANHIRCLVRDKERTP